MQELNVQAKTENLEQVIDFVNQQLEKINCSMKAQIQIDVAVEEIFVNVSHYAYQSNVGEVIVRIQICQTPLKVVITFIDKGIPYNPLDKKDPDVTLSAEEREIGGLGIYMVKKSMDNVTYVYEEGQNILTIYKEIV